MTIFIPITGSILKGLCMLEVNLSTWKRRDSASMFIEELSDAQFTTYANVALLSGVTQGTVINAGAGWLKFNLDGKELIVAKKTTRHTLTWHYLNGLGCIFGEKIINVLGKQYKVRVLTGADNNPPQLPQSSGRYIEGTHNSEWSRLFYPLIRDDSYIPNININAIYTKSELQMSINPYSWCQETFEANTAQRVVRGGVQGPTYLLNASGTASGTGTGWRPCLELIP